MRKIDKVGLPLALKIIFMEPGADDPSTPADKMAPLLKSCVDAGKTGIAVGEGFYKYDENGNVIK